MPQLEVLTDNGRKNVVDMIESLLERAKQGEIHSFGAVGLMSGNRFVTSFQTADDGDKVGLIGAIEHLKHRIHVTLDGLGSDA